MKSFLDLATAAARMAGEVLTRHNRQLHVEYKDPGKHNLVSNIDLESEKVITGLIKERFPGHQILAEEGGLLQQAPPREAPAKPVTSPDISEGLRKRTELKSHVRCGNASKASSEARLPHVPPREAPLKGVTSPYKWIIDPLDGTTNYVHGFPFFCVSIGLEYDGAVILGVVYDPFRNDLFYASKGTGAFLNGQPIRVSKENELRRSLLVTGFPYDFRENPGQIFSHFFQLSQASQGVRRTGSAALDLCYLAAGYFDGFWELNLSPWDVAAGSLIVEEAGGRVSGFNGEALSIYSKNILASNGQIHSQMAELLQKTA
ncbi:MAG: inositol monophosphatase [Nitrospirae bacterium]|nr:inositol monophosphatase [Nitrospirota bacterium]